MQAVTITQISPSELKELINSSVTKALSKSLVSESPEDPRPHRTRKETADFFGVSLNCINDWANKGILKPIKVGQRTYFKYSDLCELLNKKGGLEHE